MDTINTITSSSESETDKLSANDNQEVNYDCDTDSECDSENETIDVICENSNNRTLGSDARSRFFSYSQRIPTVSGETSVIVPSKSLIDQSSSIKPDYVDSDITVTSRSKTFLIDNILGNSVQSKSVSNDIETLEEHTDEHNGNYIF